MSSSLSVSIGQYYDKGRREFNKCFHGAYYPREPLLSSKGIAIAIADGINSNHLSQIASETSVVGFLEDYFCTSEKLSVKHSAHRVLTATNSWFYSQAELKDGKPDKDRGYFCTFSALILESNTAHLLHIGDTRIYRLRADKLEQLTTDHGFLGSENNTYPTCGLGIKPLLEFDYTSMLIELGDIYLMASDSIYQFVSPEFIIEIINEHQHDFDFAAELIVEKAYQNGSEENLTVQLIKVDTLPN